MRHREESRYAQSQLGLVLRAAALADLYLAGLVTGENGKVRAVGDRRPTGDPLHASRIEARSGAVLALAACGEIATVISRSERHEHRQYLDELAVHTGPIADALRKAWRTKKAQQASG